MEMDNLWQVLNWKFSIILGLFAAIIALFQAIFNTTQKLIEHRWEKAKLSHDMLDALFAIDEPAYKALDMLDDTDNLSRIRIALNINTDNLDKSKTSQEIRFCFDSLFYFLERIEHSLEIRIIKFNDIKSYFKYYADLLNKDNLFINYANHIHYYKVKIFLDKFN